MLMNLSTVKKILQNQYPELRMEVVPGPVDELKIYLPEDNSGYYSILKPLDGTDKPKMVWVYIEHPIVADGLDQISTILYAHLNP